MISSNYFENRFSKFYDFTNEKTLANRIFGLKHRDYNQKEFSSINSDNTSLAVQNTEKRLI
jgi:hypothetical protein